MSEKIPVAILGTGLIGTDLLMKVIRSPLLECVMFAGQRKDSPGIEKAKEFGIPTSDKSIDAILKSNARIVFSATTAKAHQEHSPKLKDRFVLDLTPSHIGKLCVPEINLEECLSEQELSLGSCGVQATIPLINALVNPSYVEVVSTIASKSAGLGTRNNIDEYTRITSDAITELCQVKSKAIIILNPAEPPIVMHNTIYAVVERKPNLKKVVARMKEYVPGYRLILKPVFETNRLTFINEVTGSGDYLPPYAGNLDMINCIALYIAESYAKKNQKD